MLEQSWQKEALKRRRAAKVRAAELKAEQERVASLPHEAKVDMLYHTLTELWGGDCYTVATERDKLYDLLHLLIPKPTQHKH